MSDKQLTNDDDQQVEVDGGPVQTVDLDPDLDSPFDTEAERAHLESVYGPFDDEDDDDGDESQGALAGAGEEDDAGGEEADDGDEDDDASVYGQEDGDSDGPDGQDDAGDEFQDGYDPQKASEPVRRRIDNLTRRRRLAETAREQADAALTAERQRADALQAQLEQAIGNQVDVAVSSLEERRERLREDLRTAIEAGDTDKQVELQDEMAGVSAQLQLAGLRQRAQPSADPDDDGGDDQPASQPAANQQPTQMTPATNAWYRRNVAWFEHPNYAWANQLARKIDAEMSADGRVHDEAYFQELDRRLIEEAPTLKEFIDVPDPKPAADPGEKPKKAGKRGKRKPARTPVAPAGNGGGEGRTRVTITQADTAKMERFGLDPENPEDVKAFAQSKIETAADFENRGHRA